MMRVLERSMSDVRTRVVFGALEYYRKLDRRFGEQSDGTTPSPAPK